MSQTDFEAVRQLARELARRTQEDPAFAERILDDPTSTLTNAGLPEDYVEEFLVQSQLSDVQGYHSLSCGLTVII